MSDEIWLWVVRAAGGFQLLTVVLAWFTPIPPDWERNLTRLPELHRRFAVAQNLAIGGVMVFLGLVCMGWAPVLVEGGSGGRLWAAAVALWWGGRLVILPWLGVRPTLTSPRLRVGYRLLQGQCLIYALAFAWLAWR